MTLTHDDNLDGCPRDQVGLTMDVRGGGDA